MATTPNDPTESFAGLDQVIADYLQAVEAGQVPNRDELLARHPDLAEPLRAFLADLDRVDLQAAPLRLAGDGGHVDVGSDEGFGLIALADHPLLRRLRIAGRDRPRRVEQLCGPFVRLLSAALEKETVSYARSI